jgi:predicted nuclease of restriction endonuclease-like (RecB) superfamily
MVAKRIVQQPAASLPSSYAELLEDLKARIRTARVQAALAVNRKLVLLYWHIGKEILQKQEQEGWGAKVIERLADDLRREFPDMQGLSRRNLFYKRAFAEAYPDGEFVQQVAAQLPWFHNVTVLTKVKDASERKWYLRACVEHGWSRAVLTHQIESGLYHRRGKALTNFASTPAAELSEREQQVLTALVDGLSYKMIADQYCISIDTVRSHIKHIYEKLHIHSKAEAIALALKSRR